MQLLDNATVTGRAHPDTSHQAAGRALGRTGTARHRVLTALNVADMTDEEMQIALHIGANTQRPRRVELVRLGYVTDSETRRNTFTGNRSIVWTITAAGQRALRQLGDQN
jgi:hypothetical protein